MGRVVGVICMSDDHIHIIVVGVICMSDDHIHIIVVGIICMSDVTRTDESRVVCWLEVLGRVRAVLGSTTNMTCLNGRSI